MGAIYRGGPWHACQAGQYSDSHLTAAVTLDHRDIPGPGPVDLRRGARSAVTERWAAGRRSNGVRLGVGQPPPSGNRRDIGDSDRRGPVIEMARARDHRDIHRFLLAVLQEPSLAEFQAALAAPRYEPLDRLVSRQGREIVAHLQLSHRELYFGGNSVLSVDLRHLGVLPECRELGLAEALLRFMETETNLHAAKLVTVRTGTPELFRQQGWVTWLHHGWSSAAPRRLLSRLESVPPRPEAAGAIPQRDPPISVRLWRRSELDALRSLYAAQMAGQAGAVARDEADWQWLICHRGFDRIYLALRSHAAASESPAAAEDVLGYAVAQHGRIVELVADRGTDAARQLLLRFCGDAIETGRHAVRLEAPPQDSLHDHFVAAGGQHVVSSHSEGSYLMAKLLHPWDWLRSLKHILPARVEGRGEKLPLELSLCAEGQPAVRIRLHKRQATFERCTAGTTRLAVTSRGLHSLLLGQYDAAQLVKLGHLRPSSRRALELARLLFPRCHGWRNPWDDLPARQD